MAVSRDMRSAVRINPLCEFNNAIVMSDRPLRDGELFEVTIDKLVDRWSGSLEAGEWGRKGAWGRGGGEREVVDHEA